MKRNTGMTAKDSKAGKTSKLAPEQANKVNKILKDSENDPPPTKTVEAVKKLRETKKNETTGVLLKHKPITKKD